MSNSPSSRRQSTGELYGYRWHSLQESANIPDRAIIVSLRSFCSAQAQSITLGCGGLWPFAARRRNNIGSGDTKVDANCSDQGQVFVPSRTSGRFDLFATPSPNDRPLRRLRAAEIPLTRPVTPKLSAMRRGLS